VTWLWLLGLALLMFWAVGVHQRFLALRQQVVQAFTQLSMLTTQRAALAEPLLALWREQPGGVDLADRFRAAERQLQAAIDLVRARPHQADAYRSLGLALVGARHVSQSVLSLPSQAGEGAETALAGWQQAESSLDFALDMFNQAVDAHAQALHRWPARAVALARHHQVLPHLPLQPQPSTMVGST
jgi:LemA protein